jgi:Uma2 family endonuclease
MLTTERKKKQTVEDYMLPQQGSPDQLINNDWIKLPPPSIIHQLILARIIQAISNFLDRINDKGFLAPGPIDVVLDAKNILHPDIFYISENKKSVIVKGNIEGSPDLIVEIISMESAYYDMRQKKDIYEKHGVKEYIIIDTISARAEIYGLRDGVYFLEQKVSETSELKSLLLPGLILDMGRIFRS